MKKVASKIKVVRFLVLTCLIALVASFVGCYSNECAHYAVYDVAIDQTCTQKGWTWGSHCALCGEIIIEQKKIDESGHSTIVQKEVPATCEKNGLTQGSYCAVCGEIFEEQKEIQAIGHNYVDGICSHCGGIDYSTTDASYFNFKLLHDSTYAVSAKNVNEMPRVLVIPSSYKGKAVTQIGESAFENCSNLNLLVIPDCVTTVGNRAFYECKNLTSVTLGSGVKTVGELAFSWCIQLNSVLFNEAENAGVEITFGDGAFSYCINLKSIELPNGVAKVGNNQFFACHNLVSIAIPASVTAVGEGAFSECSCFKTVHYAGSASEWAKVVIGSNNTALTQATINYQI